MPLICHMQLITLQILSESQPVLHIHPLWTYASHLSHAASNTAMRVGPWLMKCKWENGKGLHDLPMHSEDPELLSCISPSGCSQVLHSSRKGLECVHSVRGRGEAACHHVVEDDTQSPHVIFCINQGRMDVWQPIWEVFRRAVQTLHVQQWRGCHSRAGVYVWFLCSTLDTACIKAACGQTGNHQTVSRYESLRCAA